LTLNSGEKVGDVPKYASEVGDARQKSGGEKKKGGGSGKKKGAGGKKVRPGRLCPPRHLGQSDDLVPPIHAVEADLSLSLSLPAASSSPFADPRVLS
jgi:hypothetical protein